MKHRIALARTLLASSLILAGSAPVVPAAHVLLTNGVRIDGTGIRVRSDGSISIETTNGTQTFPKEQVSKAEADKPAELDQVAKLMSAQKYDEAIPLLEGVVKQYRALSWDVYALKALPQVYDRKGDSAGALQAYERLLRDVPASAQEPDVLFGYCDALLKTQQYGKLEGKLDDLIAKGSRPDAARAQLIRGDARAAQGQLEDAVLDYLRTVILFSAETEVQPAAIFRTAETLEKLRDPRAGDFYRKVATEYPGSPEAAKAKAKI